MNNSFIIKISIISTIILVCLNYLFDSKDASKYEKQKGIVVYYNPSFMKYNSGKSDEYRYISLSNYPYIFEIKTQGQASRLDSIRLGEIATIVYSETSDSKSVLNKSAEQIWFNDRVVYQHKSYGKTFVFITLTLAVLTLCIVLYKAKKSKKK